MRCLLARVLVRLCSPSQRWLLCVVQRLTPPPPRWRGMRRCTARSTCSTSANGRLSISPLWCTCCRYGVRRGSARTSGRWARRCIAGSRPRSRAAWSCCARRTPWRWVGQLGVLRLGGRLAGRRAGGWMDGWLGTLVHMLCLQRLRQVAWLRLHEVTWLHLPSSGCCPGLPSPFRLAFCAADRFRLLFPCLLFPSFQPHPLFLRCL